MPKVSFTANLQRHLSCETTTADGRTVGDALEAVFRDNPRLRGYILDDQGAVRKHISVYLNDETILDRAHLSDAVQASDEIFVMQALSGG